MRLRCQRYEGCSNSARVRTVKIACIEPARIERRAGRLDKATAKAVAQKLKGFLGGCVKSGR
jgi:mRNA-degrading endonuclease toxin of MazEF toxin-antitoxin module